jgi:hypothetical protein
MEHTEGDASLADDLLRGVPAIAAFLGENPRRMYYLLEKGLIPAGKVGASWVGSKRTIRAHLTQVTSGGGYRRSAGCK